MHKPVLSKLLLTGEPQEPRIGGRGLGSIGALGERWGTGSSVPWSHFRLSRSAPLSLMRWGSLVLTQWEVEVIRACTILLA